MSAAVDHTPRLRWGLLGSGRILDKLAPALRLARGVEWLAIASRDEARARAVAAQHGVPRAYGGYANLLADPDIDIVLNALHNGLHCEWTVHALAAGKHVLCEKPLARAAAEVEEMHAAARRHERWLLEGFMYRFHPQLDVVRELIAAGQIGAITHVRAAYLSGGRERKNPRYRKETGGGVLLDLGCYCVNFLRAFAGGEPARVHAHAQFDPETGIDLTLAGMLEFADGVTGQFATSFAAEGLFSADIIGSEGRIHIPHPWRPPAWPAELHLIRGGKAKTHTVNPAGYTTDPLLPFALEIEHLSACARENRPPCYPGGADAATDSRAQARVLDDLARSAAGN